MEPIDPETQQFILTHRQCDVRSLALSGRKGGVDIQTALTQIAGWQAASRKIPTWSGVPQLRYPPHLSLEQCSSEQTARYKASLLSGERLVDLTGGFGVDCYFLSQHFQYTTYVEQQPTLCQIAAHNFAALGAEIEVVCAECVAYLQQMEKVSCIFIDPARRDDAGRKMVGVEACTPNVAAIEQLLLSKADRVCIKLSPMLDLTMALQQLHHVSAVHIVAVNNECKELLLCLTAQNDGKEITVHCVNNNNSYTYIYNSEADAPCHYTNHLGLYLYEPNSAILKAGAFKRVAADWHVAKLHPNSHLYTSNELLPEFPGRIFKVVAQHTFAKQAVKTVTALAQANITVRNFPLNVAELRKRLKLTDGGDVYLFATTLANGQKTLVECRKA